MLVASWAGPLPEAQCVRGRLEDYGITEPALGEPSGQVSLAVARGVGFGCAALPVVV